MKTYKIQLEDTFAADLEALADQFRDAGIDIDVSELIVRLIKGNTLNQIKQYELSKV